MPPLAIPTWFSDTWRNCGIKVNHAGVEHSRRRERRPHRNRDLYVLMSACGQRHVLRQGEHQLTIDDGQVCLLPPGHGFSAEVHPLRSDGCTYLLDFFVVRGTGQMDPLTLLPLPAVADRLEDDRDRWEELLEHFVDWRPRKGASLLRYRPLADRLVGDALASCFAAGLGSGAPGERIPGWLWELRSWLRGSYKDADLDLTAIARRTGFSPSQVGHAFTRHFGVSPMAFVREQRLALACRFLREQPETPVAEIARRCGYGGASQFSRTFRQAMGISPSVWRRSALGETG